MRNYDAQLQIRFNGIAAAAKDIGVSKRTLWRWSNQNYTITSREGRKVLRPRVVVNTSKSAKCGALILTAVYDAEGKRIWHAKRISTILRLNPKTKTLEQFLQHIYFVTDLLDLVKNKVKPDAE